MFKDFETNLDKLKVNIENIITSNEKALNRLLKLEKKNFINFVRVFSSLQERLEIEFTQLSHLNSVNNSKKTQEVYNYILPIITQYSTKLSQNEKIYRVFKEIYNKDSLTLEQKKVLENEIRDFELSGVGLKGKKKKRLKEINLKLSQLSNDFSQNILDATNSYELIIDNKKDVKGIPSSDLESAKIKIKGKTKYRFTLQIPSYLAYITYGVNRKLRKKLYKAYSTRASQNSKIIDEILALRDEEAKILGFKNYANLSLASKMAKTTKDVVEFLETLAKKSKKQAIQDLQEVKKIAKKDGVSKLKSYDLSFYSEKLRKKRYAIDEEKYRVYFEKNSVIKGLFKFLEKLFGIKFREVNLKLWDKKAKAYDLEENGKIIARLYLDLEARETKRDGAWMHNWHSHSFDENKKENLASAFVVCNFPPSNKNYPSLLRHNDVVTLFHEMGHALHHLFSKTNESLVSGVNGVECDSVEFPSQFLENFAYELEVLQIFAKHYKSGKVIDKKMIKKLKKAKNFQSAMMMIRQIEFSLFDFKLHLKLYQKDEVQTLLDKIRKEISVIIPPTYNKFQNSFSHIFAGGYAAGYYSYKWAEVLSADAFIYFKKNGIFNKKIAQKYKKSILEKGGSASMKELFYNFLKREYKIESLLELNGIN